MYKFVANNSHLYILHVINTYMCQILECIECVQIIIYIVDGKALWCDRSSTGSN